jgi:multiple sugar transport system substrate-binding protein
MVQRARQRRIRRRLGLGLVPVILLLCLGLLWGAARASTSKQVTLTMWSEEPTIGKVGHVLWLFNKTHPGIHVNLVVMPTITVQNTKLRAATAAHSGLPDTVFIDFPYVPQYEVQKYEGHPFLLDLAPYGANKVKDRFLPWTWNQAVVGKAVYGIPNGIGPMVLLYRQDIFSKYHLPVPKTWAQYASEAVKLHKLNPKIYLTDFPPDSGWLTALLWQAGARPFTPSNNFRNLKLAFDSAPAQKVVKYWSSLIKRGAVDTIPDFTTAWYKGLVDGTYASWPTAVWGPVFLAGLKGMPKDVWRVALLPQWSPGESSSGNWGGGVISALASTKHPAEAAELAIWMNSDPAAVRTLWYKDTIFPDVKSLLQSPRFLNIGLEFFGSQKGSNRVMAKAATQVDTGFGWSPFADYADTVMNDQLASATKGHITFQKALANMQKQLSDYAKQQGVKVSP